jgi:hypothetical protein
MSSPTSAVLSPFSVRRGLSPLPKLGETDGAPPLSSYRYIILQTRALTPTENKAIADKFQNVVVADDTFMASRNDLSQMKFDTLLVDLRNKVLASWYNEIRQQVKENDEFRVVVVYQKTFCNNLDPLVNSLEANSVIKGIPLDVADAERFLRKLLATKSSRIKTICCCFTTTVNEE